MKLRRRHRKVEGVAGALTGDRRVRVAVELGDRPTADLVEVGLVPPPGHRTPRAVRVEFRRLAAHAGVRRRFAPHQLRHAHAVESAREGVPLNVIQRQLGHANLGTTTIYLQGIDTEEIIATVHARRAPMMSATAGLQL